MRQKRPKWASESAMCAAFMDEARSRGWLVYPECSGNDIVLVATDDCAGASIDAGDVVAIEAKLSANIAVMSQALPPEPPVGVRMLEAPVADFYAVLVPGGGQVGNFTRIARRLQITVLAVDPPSEKACLGGNFDPWDGIFSSSYGFGALNRARRYDRAGRPRLWVPAVEVDMPAGLPAPRGLTPWKMAAVRFCLGAGSEFTSTEMRAAGINPSIAETMGWVERILPWSRPIRYRLTEHDSRPDLRYREIATALKDG